MCVVFFYTSNDPTSEIEFVSLFWNDHAMKSRANNVCRVCYVVKYSGNLQTINQRFHLFYICYDLM